MMQKLIQWLRKLYIRIINSIAFFPALIALGFLLLVILMMELDLSGWGLQLNENIKWLRLTDADTARTIVGTIAGGVISLTVFNFSMFMVVLNQAASQMSNRMLENMIGDRFQKLILGFYVGTIVYALFLLSNINEGEDANYVPIFSIYLLLLFTIIDIFLFIYFLHYITQSFRYEQLIHRIHEKTVKALHQQKEDERGNKRSGVVNDGAVVLAPESGYFQSFSTDQLVKIAKKKNTTIRFLHSTGDYILKGTPFLEISNIEKADDDLRAQLFAAIDFYRGQPIAKNVYYGFQHLMEIGIKALSPGINDPVTAVLCLHALTDLFACKLVYEEAPVFVDEDGWPRVVAKARSLTQTFDSSILPIWHYGRNDQHIQQALLRLVEQLRSVDKEKQLAPALQLLHADVTEQQQKASKPF